MSETGSDPGRARQRQRRHAFRLKRRLTVASVAGFVAFFTLAAQHVVRAASSTTRQAERGGGVSTARPTTFFDQQDQGFSVGDTSPTISPDPGPTSTPMAQTSVS